MYKQLKMSYGVEEDQSSFMWTIKIYTKGMKEDSDIKFVYFILVFSGYI